MSDTPETSVSATTDQPAADPRPFKVRIIFGSKPYRRESSNVPSEFAFATAAELDAFLLGVEETSGYLDHEQIDPNPDGSWPAVKMDGEEEDGEEE
jgi:hypothetical protein